MRRKRILSVETKTGVLKNKKILVNQQYGNRSVVVGYRSVRESSMNHRIQESMRMGEFNVLNVKSVSFILVLLILGGFQESSLVEARPLLSSSSSRPRPADAAPFARWLVSHSSWGVLNTIADDLGGAPFGNVVSFSDGQPDSGSGIPYFYLTTLDPTASYALKDQRSSFTISEYNIGTCGNKDPENPSCAKITLTGKLNVLDNKSNEAEYAQSALFSKHPEMEDWPKGHNFQIFKLDIENIFLINWFGGPKPLTPDEYLHTSLNKLSFTI